MKIFNVISVWKGEERIVPWGGKSPCENANPRAKTKNDVFKSGQFMKEKKSVQPHGEKKLSKKKRCL